MRKEKVRDRTERQGREGRGKGGKEEATGEASEESAGRGVKGTKAKGREGHGKGRQSKGNMRGARAQINLFYVLTHQQPITKFAQGFQTTNLKAWLPTSEIEPMPTLQTRNIASGCWAKCSLCDTTKLMGCTVKISWNSLESTIVGA